MPEPSVLVTGCSSGIGSATVRHLSRRGIPVVATARNPASLADLASLPGVRIAALDVTDPEACARVVRESAPLRGLVNNAGYGLLGPLEEISDERLREQFEVNVFAVHRLARLSLPLLRETRGRIVVVGSCVGRFAYPIGGPYCATKHALEAWCDALRVEVAPFGVRVVLIEPGPIATRFTENARRSYAGLAIPENSPYRALHARAEVLMTRRGLPPGSPDRVAHAILLGLTRHTPRARYVVTNRARGLIALRRVLPDLLWDYLVSKVCRLR
jgi:NAD(P)-dependent dehydrogenase (short-subunit alcohol dehydrogenase family)